MVEIKDKAITDKYCLYNGDSCEILPTLPADSVHYIIYSPPFASLYTYSNSDRDLGNCRNDEEFFEHFEYIARELYRVLKPGRLMSFHCMNLPTFIANGLLREVHHCAGAVLKGSHAHAICILIGCNVLIIDRIVVVLRPLQKRGHCFFLRFKTGTKQILVLTAAQILIGHCSNRKAGYRATGNTVQKFHLGIVCQI